jgi:hypothetical protein
MLSVSCIIYSGDDFRSKKGHTDEYLFQSPFNIFQKIFNDKLISKSKQVYFKK